jgi:hypothetical protein
VSMADAAMADVGIAVLPIKCRTNVGLRGVS